MMYKHNRTVFLTGLTSFFTDVSTEMAYPLIQAFVSVIFATQKALVGPALGIIEGIAESTASLLKVFSGYYSDRIGARKWPTVAGYGISALSKLLFFLASIGWYFVLLARFFDRVGKGVRSAPRDALIYESTSADTCGAAFGLQRAMDFAGATLGVAICYFAVRRFCDPLTGNIRDIHSFYTMFAISVVPAFLGVLVLLFVREPRSQADAVKKTKPRPSLDIRGYDGNLKLFFIAQGIFTLGNSSNQFLLLRSMDLGFVLSSVILMYLVFNFSSSILSSFFGKLSDRTGRRTVLIAGYALYALVYGSFGCITRSNSALVWIFWIIYGVYYAMCEGVEKAFVGDLAPAESKATALGFFHTIAGIGLLPASVIAGFLFSVNPAAPFVFGACTSVSAGIVVLLFVKERTR